VSQSWRRLTAKVEEGPSWGEVCAEGEGEEDEGGAGERHEDNGLVDGDDDGEERAEGHALEQAEHAEVEEPGVLVGAIIGGGHGEHQEDDSRQVGQEPAHLQVEHVQERPHRGAQQTDEQRGVHTREVILHLWRELSCLENSGLHPCLVGGLVLVEKRTKGRKNGKQIGKINKQKEENWKKLSFFSWKTQPCRGDVKSG